MDVVPFPFPSVGEKASADGLGPSQTVDPLASGQASADGFELSARLFHVTQIRSRSTIEAAHTSPPLQTVRAVANTSLCACILPACLPACLETTYTVADALISQPSGKGKRVAATDEKNSPMLRCVAITPPGAATPLRVTCAAGHAARQARK